jgi:perosamine synthetase
MTNGATVAAFERAFEDYVGAKYAVALCNGTATLHTALVALGVKPGDRVAVPPLTMSATTIAVLHAGAVPVFIDVRPDTWTMDWVNVPDGVCAMPVSLYGLTAFSATPVYSEGTPGIVDDAAQRLGPAYCLEGFTSYSFQASKILALGEGGMLVTDSEELATRARAFSSLGYRMRADQPRIDPAVLKHPTYARHHALGWNYRMNDLTAAKGLVALAYPDMPNTGVRWCLAERRKAAALYADAITGCDWLTPQLVPEGWTHDYWAFAVACDTPARALALQEAVTRHGGERPYGAWRLTYQEPAFRHLAPDGTCPVAESLQPRLLQFQTNNTASAERNAAALRLAIRELGGAR